MSKERPNEDNIRPEEKDRSGGSIPPHPEDEKHERERKHEEDREDDSERHRSEVVE